MPSKVQCKHCANLINEWCARVIDSPDADMLRSCPYYKALTNADRIRSMTDDVELAIFLENVKIDGLLKGQKYPYSKFGWLDWLKQEVN